MRPQDDHSQPAPNPLDLALTRALEAPPQPLVPDDFALRLLSRLPAEVQPTRNPSTWAATISEPHLGRRTAIAAAALLLAAFVLLPLLTAHAAASHPLAYLAVWAILAAEFIVLTVWLSLRPDTLR